MAKKLTKKQQAELQKKSEMVDYLIESAEEVFGYLSDEPMIIKMIKYNLTQFGYDIDDLKTEDCDFIFKRVLMKCQDIYDRMSDRFFFQDFNPDKPFYVAVDDPNSDTHKEIDSLIESYDEYTDKRLYTMVPENLIEAIKQY